MARRRLYSIVIAVCSAGTGGVGAVTEPVSQAEADRWLQYVTPLPHEIVIRGRVTLSAGQIAVSHAASTEVLVRQAASELRQALGSPSITQEPVFTLTLQLGGLESETLSRLKNGEQGYRIIPEDSGDGLRLIALTPRGVYYAGKTLQQLIRANASDNEVSIPIVKATDWPDMAIRGVWGVDASSQVRWLSDRKYNYMEQIASSRIDKDGKPVSSLADFKQQMIEDGPSHGISPVPSLVHLEQIGHGGLFNHYPELQGKGEGIHEGAVCYSNPLFAGILAEWMIGYLSMPGVDEVDVWMAENLGGKPGCQCGHCKGQNRDLLELRVILSAWDKAGRQKPHARLSILSSEETADSNEQILEALPPEIRFWYYHSLLTYNTSERPMVPGYVARAAAQGREVGVCLNLSPHSTNYQPMTGVQFIHYRMKEFNDKGIPGMLGYPTPRVVYYRFNTEAAAEWSWNAEGRTPREFAYSWAVRRGMEDPELFAEWAMVHGEVAWDVYGSEYPAGEARKATGKIAEQLKTCKLPELGFVLWGIYPKPWGDIRTAEQLDRDVELSERAVILARRLNDASLLHESLTIQGYMQSLKSLYELKQIVTPEGVALKDRAAALRHFQTYLDALDQSRTHLARWEMEVAQIARPRHVRKVCNLLTRMIEEMTVLADELGFTLEGGQRG